MITSSVLFYFQIIDYKNFYEMFLSDKTESNCKLEIGLEQQDTFNEYKNKSNFYNTFFDSNLFLTA